VDDKVSFQECFVIFARRHSNFLPPLGGLGGGRVDAFRE
jgi:hypothetical protein